MPDLKKVILAFGVFLTAPAFADTACDYCNGFGAAQIQVFRSLSNGETVPLPAISISKYAPEVNFYAEFFAYINSMDAYFLLVTPSQQVFSIVRGALPWQRRFGLTPGYVPLASGIRVGAPRSVEAGTLHRNEPSEQANALSYKFAPGDEVGTYVLYAIAVREGKDPREPKYWYSAQAKFLKVEP